MENCLRRRDDGSRRNGAGGAGGGANAFGSGGVRPRRSSRKALSRGEVKGEEAGGLGEVERPTGGWTANTRALGERGDLGQCPPSEGPKGDSDLLLWGLADEGGGGGGTREGGVGEHDAGMPWYVAFLIGPTGEFREFCRCSESDAAGDTFAKRWSLLSASTQLGLEELEASAFFQARGGGRLPRGDRLDLSPLGCCSCAGRFRCGEGKGL